MSNVLHISGLNKSYNGRKVVDNISLDVETGDIVGLIGPNGAGKSTTMKMVMRYLVNTVRCLNRNITML